MTSIVSGGGSSAEFQTYDDVQLKQATQNLDHQPRDTVSSASPTHSLGDAYLDAYVNPPSKVELPTPTSTAMPSQEVMVDRLMALREAANGNTQTLTKNVIKMTEDQKVFYEAMNSHINALSAAQLQEIAYQPGMSKEAIQEQIIFAMLHPDAEVPENVRTLANQVYTTSLADAQQQLGPAWTPVSLEWAMDAGIMLNMQNIFDGVVKGLNIGNEEADQLRFAMENPEAASSLSPKLQAIFKQVMGKVQKQAQFQMGLPSGWQVPKQEDSGITSLTANFDQRFSAAVQKMVDEGKITESQSRQLETLHYNPDADVPDAAKLKGMVKDIETPILKELQKLWGFPPDYRPAPGASSHDATINALYMSSFDKLLNNASPPLSEEQKALIRAAQGGNGPVLSPALQAVSDKIKGMAVAEMKATYGLPDDWAAPIAAIPNFSTAASSHETLSAILNHGKETLAAGQKLLEGMPNTELKNTYMVFLSLCATSLAKLAEALTITSITQSKISHVLSEMRLDQSINKIKKEQRALEKMRKEQESQQKTGIGAIFTNIINWVINIVLIVVTLGTAIALIVDAAEHGKDLGSLSLVNYAFEVANRIVGKPLGTWLLVLLVIAIAILALLSPIFLVLLIVVVAVVLVDVWLGNGDIVTNLLLAVGFDETTAAILSMVICMIIGIVIDIILSVLIEVCTLGTGTEVTVALWTAKIAMYTAKVVTFIVRIVTTIISKIVAVCRLVGTILKTIMKVVQAVVKAIMKLIDLAMQTIKTIIAAAKKIAQEAADAVKTVIKTSVKKATTLADDIMEAAIKKTATKLGKESAELTEEVAQNAAVKFMKKSVNKAGKLCKKCGLDKAGKWVKKEVKSAFTSSGDDLVESEVKVAKSSYDKLVDSIQNLGDVKRQEEKIEKLKDLQSTMQDLKSLEKKMEKAQDATQYEGEYKALKNTLNDIIEGVKDAEGNVIEKGVKDFDEGLGNKVVAWEKLHESEKNFKLAKMEFKAAKNVGRETIEEEADYQAKKAAYKSAEEINDKAQEEVNKLFEEGMIDYVIKAKEVVGSAMNAINNIQGIQNNLLEAKLARLKAALEAYLTEMDFMIKLLKDTAARLMESVTALGNDISDIGKQIRHLYQSNSQTMTALSMAA